MTEEKYIGFMPETLEDVPNVLAKYLECHVDIYRKTEALIFKVIDVVEALQADAVRVHLEYSSAGLKVLDALDALEKD